MFDSMMKIFDFFFVGWGIYCLYVGLRIRLKHEMDKVFMYSGKLEMKQCTDKEAYMAYIAPRLLIFGVLAILFGLLCLCNDYSGTGLIQGIMGPLGIGAELLRKIAGIAYFVFLVPIVWLLIVLRRTLIRYFPEIKRK